MRRRRTITSVAKDPRIPWRAGLLTIIHPISPATRSPPQPLTACRHPEINLYTNGDTVWTYEQMRDVVFPAEIEGVDMDQFIGGELSFEDWLAESLNTGIYKKVDE